MQDLLELRQFWLEHFGYPLALCTIVRKEGSAYRAIGAKKLISKDGGSKGLLSGGCLEADIEDAVRENWNDLPFIRSFNTTSPEDKLFGYQTGCSGIIDVLCEQIPSGADIRLYLPYGSNPEANGVLVSLDPDSFGARSFCENEPELGSFYFDGWVHPIKLFVVGCGLDAVPFHGLSQQLGWETHFIDYRESLRPHMPNDAKLSVVPLGAIPDLLAPGSRTSIIVMTHNYQADLEIITRLAGLHSQGAVFGYIGCLGPRKRFDQIRQDTDTLFTEAFVDICHAPPGLFGNTHSPETIALSIIADIAARFSE